MLNPLCDNNESIYLGRERTTGVTTACSDDEKVQELYKQKKSHMRRSLVPRRAAVHAAAAVYTAPRIPCDGPRGQPGGQRTIPQAGLVLVYPQGGVRRRASLGSV